MDQSLNFIFLVSVRQPMHSGTTHAKAIKKYFIYQMSSSQVDDLYKNTGTAP